MDSVSHTMMIALFFFGIAISLAVLAYGYRSRLQQAVNQIAYLYGRLVESEKKAGEWKELAREAIHVAAKQTNTIVELPQTQNQVTTYVPPVVAYCPACGVSVRNDPSDYPVKCPREGCNTLIDPVLDNPPTLS